MNLFRNDKITVLLMAFCLIIDSKSVIAQEVLPAKYFVGINASILWNTTGFSTGLSGERIIASQKNKELSVKAAYMFRHRLDNLILFSSSAYDINSAETIVIIEGYLFTNKQKSINGFFRSGGFGAMHSVWKYRNEPYATFLRPTVEFGLGFKFKLGDKMALRWSNDIRLASPQPEAYMGINTTTTFSLGF